MINFKVILICGLPGSGKTFLGNKLSKETGFEFLDDILDKDHLKKLLQNNKSCIISDPNFTFETVREAAIDYFKCFNVTIEWIFFDNSPEKCINNVDHRNDGKLVKGFIKSFSKYYSIPANEKVIPCYEPI